MWTLFAFVASRLLCILTMNRTKVARADATALCGLRKSTPEPRTMASRYARAPISFRLTPH